jgi:hypothetical protein
LAAAFLRWRESGKSQHDAEFAEAANVMTDQPLHYGSAAAFSRIFITGDDHPRGHGVSFCKCMG